ncbi:hypothetical protein BDP27DRAFT_1405965 [Rhodocollybia butyracea]|uniref:F-box domain-containing protein n=1 Tax=Rhodocollybia butyracea TaxID=206335 RepID=A0A9P5U1M2_9AGAR|nr:hypothetical protein BDP27DRAFT_1405965 [Rhodocollybia butyracea]
MHAESRVRPVLRPTTAYRSSQRTIRLGQKKRRTTNKQTEFFPSFRNLRMYTVHHDISDSLHTLNTRNALNTLNALNTHRDALLDKHRDLLRQLDETTLEIRATEIKLACIHNESNAFISRLPPELLSLVFLVLQEEVPFSHFAAARVCSGWRALVNGTPLLWGNIVIRVDEKRPAGIEAQLHKLETSLARSGRYDARVLLYVYAFEHGTAHLVLRDELEYLCAPQLEYLGLYVAWAPDIALYGDVLSNTPLIFKGGAPVLTYLQVTGIAAALRPPTGSDLTILHVDGTHMADLTAQEYREFLASTPSLVHLSLLYVEIAGPLTVMGKVELPRLRSLRLRAQGNIVGSFTSVLLDPLPLDRLDTLILCDVNDLEVFDFPNVKHLSLHFCDFDVAQVGQMMLGFRSVVTLELESASLLYMALRIEGNPVWWPHLKELSVRDLDPGDAVALLRMVQGREGMKHPLGTLYFDGPSRRRAGSVLVELKSIISISRNSLRDDVRAWPAGSMVFGWVGDDDRTMER